MAANNETKKEGLKNGPNQTGSSSTIEQVETAVMRVLMVQARTVELFNHWKSQLLRLSILIAILSIHQAGKSIASCIQDIKDARIEAKDAGGWDHRQMLETWLGLMAEFQLEMLNIALVAFTLAFMYLNSDLQKQKDEGGEPDENPWNWTAHWTFASSSTLSSALVGIFAYTKKIGCKSIFENAITEIDGEERSRSDFPVSVIFFLIVIVSYLFMSVGLVRVNRNVKLVQSLKQQMKSATKGDTTKRRSKSHKVN